MNQLFVHRLLTGWHRADPPRPVIWGPGPISLDRLVPQACGCDRPPSDSSSGFQHRAGPRLPRLPSSPSPSSLVCVHCWVLVPAARVLQPRQGWGAPAVRPPAGPRGEPALATRPPAECQQEPRLPPTPQEPPALAECQLPARPGRGQAAGEEGFSGPRPRRGRTEFQSELRGGLTPLPFWEAVPGPWMDEAANACVGEPGCGSDLGGPACRCCLGAPQGGVPLPVQEGTAHGPRGRGPDSPGGSLLSLLPESDGPSSQLGRSWGHSGDPMPPSAPSWAVLLQG